MIHEMSAMNIDEWSEAARNVRQDGEDEVAGAVSCRKAEGRY